MASVTVKHSPEDESLDPVYLLLLAPPEEDVVYHTYSAYARAVDGLRGMYQWLDRTSRGRNEARDPDGPLNWFRRHDEYDG